MNSYFVFRSPEQFTAEKDSTVIVSVFKYCSGARLEAELIGMETWGGLHFEDVTITEMSSITDPFVTRLDALTVTLNIPNKLKMMQD